jgi:hypothetical protein
MLLEVDLDLLMSVVVHLHLLSVVISHYHQVLLLELLVVP